MNTSPLNSPESLQKPVTQPAEPQDTTLSWYGHHVVAGTADSGLIFSGSGVQHDGTERIGRLVSNIEQSAKSKDTNGQEKAYSGAQFHSLEPQDFVEIPRPNTIFQPVSIIFQDVPLQNSEVGNIRPSQLASHYGSIVPEKLPRKRKSKGFWLKLVRKAIESRPERKATAHEVYRWVEQNHPELITPANHKHWRAQIRYALNKDIFQRSTIQGKGGYVWNLISVYSLNEEQIKPVSTVSTNGQSGNNAKP